MRFIYLKENAFPEAVGRFPNIDTLWFYEYGLTNPRLFVDIGKFSSLRCFRMNSRFDTRGSAQPNAPLFKAFETCYRLETIDMRADCVTLHECRILADTVPHLKVLRLNIYPEISEHPERFSREGYAHLLNSLSLLEDIHSVPDRVLLLVQSRIPLRKLWLFTIDNEDVLAISRVCHQLEVLKVDVYPRRSHLSNLLPIFRHCKTLRCVHISGVLDIASAVFNYNALDDHIYSVSDRFPSVQKLSLIYEATSRSGLVNMASQMCMSFPFLEELAVYMRKDFDAETQLKNIFCEQLGCLRSLLVSRTANRMSANDIVKRRARLAGT